MNQDRMCHSSSADIHLARASGHDHYLHRQAHNDLRVVAGHHVDPTGFTLLAILRNEMYFLPTFLAHYRNLGVERFVFLDDRSNDGTQQYLFAQPDVVIVQSNHTYGEPARERDGCPESTTTRSRRYSVLWRSLLHDMFAEGKWALQVDLDEFVCVPDGTTIREFVSTLDELDLRAVWGVMLDIYPRDIASLNELSGARLHSMSGDWYFDAERHLRLRKHRGPSVVYAGARARLYETYGVDRLYSQLKVSTKHIRHPWPSRIWSREPNFKQYNSLQVFPQARADQVGTRLPIP